MNDLQQGVVTLLKSAITGEKLSLPEPEKAVLAWT